MDILPYGQFADSPFIVHRIAEHFFQSNIPLGQPKATVDHKGESANCP